VEESVVGGVWIPGSRNGVLGDHSREAGVTATVQERVTRRKQSQRHSIKLPFSDQICSPKWARSSRAVRPLIALNEPYWV
jgi:hypothetical protein